MKTLSLSVLNHFFKGTLVAGAEEMLITNCTDSLENVKAPHTLVFYYGYQRMDLNALGKYAPLAIVTDKAVDFLTPPEGIAILHVQNVKIAYDAFVASYRSLFSIPVLAVTGTCGKTTTKDMLKHILAGRFRVTGTHHSANGRPGHLIYLLRIDDTIEAAVFETAVGEPGDITLAFKYFKPSIGIITNIGVDHLDHCKTPEAYIAAKGEMVSQLPENGTLILNADDENTKKIHPEIFKGRLVTFGIRHLADFTASDIQYKETGMSYTLTFQGLKTPIFVPGLGEHQVYNSLAAIAGVQQLGIGIKEAAEQLQSFRLMRSHLEFQDGLKGSQLIDDTFSLNPVSLTAGLRTLHEMGRGKTKICLMGDFRGMGENSWTYFKQVAEKIAGEEPDLLIIVGPTAAEIANEATACGLKSELKIFPDTTGVLSFLEPRLNSDTLLLVKCSMFDDAIKKLLPLLREDKSASR